MALPDDRAAGAGDGRERHPPEGRTGAAGAHLRIGDTPEAAQSVLDEYNWLFKEAYTVEPYNVPLGRTFFGTPDQVRAHVERLHENLGIEEFFLWHNTNFFGRERERRMVELFGQEVIAKLNG